MTIQKFNHLQPPPSFGSLVDVQVYARKLFDALFRVMQGKTQNVGEVTLRTGQTTTVVSDIRASIQSCIIFDPRTANAATEYHGGTMYILDANRGKGTFTITHANNANADRTFWYAVIG